MVQQTDFQKANYDVLRNQYNLTTLPELKNEIDLMYSEDQTYREKYIGTSFFKKIDSIDKIHSDRIREMFIKYGFPTETILGLTNENEHLERKISTLLLHSKASIRESFFLPFIKKSIETFRKL